MWGTQEVTRGKRRGEAGPKKTIVDASYRRAKAVKSTEKLRAAGKIVVPKEQKKAKKKKAKKPEQQGEGGGGGETIATAGGGAKIAAGEAGGASGMGAGGVKKFKEKRKPGVTKRSFKSKAR